jgi:molybdate transport system ATP-binding protein
VHLALDFTLRQGSFTLDIHERADVRSVGLYGHSGAGKTTLLDAIAGLRRPASGIIRVGTRTLFSSQDGIALPPRSRRIGYVPQDTALFPHLNVRRNIMYGAPARDDVDAATRVLGMLELDRFMDRRVDELSGGERQRVAVARALMSSPDLLLLDEPLAAVDVELRQRIVPYLERVRDELAIPMIYVSHNAAELHAIAEWTLVLQAGRVVAAGPTGQVL